MSTRIDMALRNLVSRRVCVRIYLNDELRRFMGYLTDRGLVSKDDEGKDRVVEDYLKQYQVDSN